MRKKAVYLLIFLLFILILLLWFFTKAVATLHSAGNLLHMPKQESVYEGVSKEELQGIQYYLPTGATLISPYRDTDRKIIKADFNYDSHDELLYCYTNYERDNEIGLSVLYYKDAVWYKALQIDKELLDLDVIQLSDVTGDGNPELLIGWKENNSEWNGLDIYTWKDSKLVKLYSTAYSKLIIDKQRNKKLFGDRDKLVIWKEINHLYLAEVLAWNNVNFVSVSDYFPEDFTALAKYYEDNETSLRDNSEYWYLRAIACISAHEYSEANASIDRAMRFDIKDSDILQYKLVKGISQTLLYKNAKAKNTMLTVINDIKKLKNTRTKNTLLMDAYYYLGRYYNKIKDYTNAYDYFDLSLNCCESVYMHNSDMLKFKIFKISKARTEAAAYAFSKQYHSNRK